MVDIDPLQQIRQTREEFAKRHGYDIRSMVAELQAQDAAGDRPVVTLEPRRPLAALQVAATTNPILAPDLPPATIG